MHASLVTVMFVGSLLAAEDRAKLQGTWKVVAISTNDPNDAALFRVIDRYFSPTMSFRGDQADGMRYRIDPMKHPKEMDLCNSCLLTNRLNRPAVLKGIYSLDGDTLTLCFDRNTRPKKFAIEPNSERELVVVKRKKP